MIIFRPESFDNGFYNGATGMGGGGEVLGGHSWSQALTILAFYQSGCEREAGERGVRV